MSELAVCSRCEQIYVAGHVCPGPPDRSGQPVREVAQIIANDGIWTDADAIRVARALLDTRETA